MDFTIISIGDINFLYEVLHVVAMLSGSSGGLAGLASIGALFGVIMVFMQSMMQGAKEVQIGHIFIALILYMCFFAPTTTVMLRDAYSLQTRFVDNVPVGVAAAGSMISQIGDGLASSFQTAYGSVSATGEHDQYADALQKLSNLRSQGNMVPIVASLNEAVGGGGSFDRSWSNYIRECTLTAVDLELRSLDDLMRGAIPDVLEFNSSLYTTQIYPPGGAQTLACDEAFSILKTMTESAIGKAEVARAVNASVNIVDNSGNPLTDYTRLTDHIQMLGFMLEEAQSYVTSSILEPIYYQAAEGRYRDFQDIASATALNQAIQQRNMQWAAEQSMFMVTVRPLMSFFEGLVYALTPIMAILVMVGGMGISMLGKYLMVLFWIQLWLPIISLTNKYITMSAGQKMITLVDSTTSQMPLSSFYALSESARVMEHWIGVGGLLMAMTPVIALFVVSGSMYTLNSVAGSLKGADTFDEKMGSPDAVAPSAVMSGQSSYEHSVLTGVSSTGASSMMGSVSLGSGMSSMVSSSQQQMEAAQQQFGSMISRGFKQGGSVDNTMSRVASIGETLGATQFSGTSTLDSLTERAVQSAGLTENQGDTVRGMLALTASGGGGLSSPGGKGAIASIAGKLGLTASAVKEQLSASGVTSEEMQALDNALNFSSEEREALTNELAQRWEQADAERVSEALGIEDSEQFSQTATDLASASRAYQEASSYEEGFQDKRNLSYVDAGNYLSRGGAHQVAAKRQLDDYWNSAAIGGETRAEQQRLQRIMQLPPSEGGAGMSEEAAVVGSRLQALFGSNNRSDTSPSQYIDNARAAVRTLNTGYGISGPEVGNPYENNGIVDNGPTPGVAQEHASRHTGNVRAQEATGDMPGYGERSDEANLEHRVPGTAANNVGDTNPVLQRNAANREAVDSSHKQAQEERYAGAQERARELLRVNDPGLAVRMLGSGSDNLGSLPTMLEQFKVFAAMGAFGSPGKALADKGFGLNASHEDRNERLEELMSDPAKAQEVFENYKEQRDNDNWSIDAIKSFDERVVGIAAAAQVALGGEVPLNEITEGMSYQEKGMLFNALNVDAHNAGAQAEDARKQERAEEHKRTLMDDFSAPATANNLTAGQRAVFMAGAGVGDKEEAHESLRREYAQIGEDGRVIEEDGRAVLSDDDERHVNTLSQQLIGASSAGSALSGAYLSNIKHYNIATGNTGQ